MARPGSYAGKPLLRKAFCGFDAHVAKSDYSLRGLRPPSPQGFLDKLRDSEIRCPFSFYRSPSSSGSGASLLSSTRSNTTISPANSTPATGQ